MARSLAAERGIFKIEELHKKLAAYGVTISSSQLGKVLRNQTKYCDLELLDALGKVLDVSFNQLLISRELKRNTPANRAATAPKGSDVKAEQTATTNHDAQQQNQTIAPPNFTALPRR